MFVILLKCLFCLFVMPWKIPIHIQKKGLLTKKNFDKNLYDYCTYLYTLVIEQLLYEKKTVLIKCHVLK